MGKSMTQKLREKVFQTTKKRLENRNRTGRSYLNYDGPVLELKKKNKFDILQYKVTDPNHPDQIPVGEFWYQRPIKVHRGIGINNDDVLCPSSIGKKCPICSYVNSLRSDYQNNKDEINALRAKDRVIYPVYNYMEKDPDKRYALLDISTFLFGNLLDEEVVEDENLACFPELEGGLTLTVRCREKKFGDKTFYEASSIVFTERQKSYSEKEILKKVPKIDDLLVWKSYKEIEKLFYEDESKDVNGEDAWTMPIAKVKKLAESFGVDPSDYEDDEDGLRDAVAVAIEESGGGKAPKPERTKKPPRGTDDDDEDDTGTDDDDEDDTGTDDDDDGTGTDDDDAGTDDDEDDDDAGTDDDEDEEPPRKPERLMRGKTGADAKTSRKPEPKPERKPEPSKGKTAPKPARDTGKERCPHGGKFGSTTDELEECESCKLWDECFAAMTK